MPRVALILPTETYRAADFMAAAADLSLDVVVVSDRRQLLADHMGDGFLLVDCETPDRAAAEIVRLAGRTPLDAVMAVDDQGVMIAALAAGELGLPHNPPYSVAATRNKAMLRRALRDHVRQPPYQIAEVGVDAVELADHVGLPVVAKPLSLSASRGVIRFDSADEAPAVVNRIRTILARAGQNPNQPLLFERFVPGEEVAVEGILHDGRLQVLTIWDKPDPLDGPVFEETILTTPSRKHPEIVEEIVATTQRAVDALGLRVGPIHAEMRVDGPFVRMIEIAARPIGGLCGRALRFGMLGTSLERVLLRAAVGMPVRGLSREDPAAGVMMLPVPTTGRLREVGGLSRARTVPHITGIEISIPAGTHVERLPEGDRYLGFVFARAERPEQVETALRQAFAALTIRIDEAAAPSAG